MSSSAVTNHHVYMFSGVVKSPRGAEKLWARAKPEVFFNYSKGSC